MIPRPTARLIQPLAQWSAGTSLNWVSPWPAPALMPRRRTAMAAAWARVKVPLGWKVVVTFVSRDASIPHSVGIVEPADPIPATSEGLEFAFRGAFSVPFTSGSRAGQTQTFDFVADREGRFWLYCGVPGHGVMGMWTYFVVSREATRPRAEVRQT